MVFLSPPLVNHRQHSKTSCALMLYLSCCKCKNPNLKEKWKFLIYLTPSKAGPGFRPSQMSICMTIFISLSSPALHFSSLLLFSLSVMSDSLSPWSMPGFPVLFYLLEFAETHVHWAGDTIQPSHPLLSPSPPVALDLSQHQSCFQSVSSLHQDAKVLELQLQHQSFQGIFRVDFL